MVMSWFRRELSEAGKAGYGPTSDGVPERIGCGLDHDSTLPAPIGTRVRLADEDITKRYRKATV